MPKRKEGSSTLPEFCQNCLTQSVVAAVWPLVGAMTAVDLPNNHPSVDSYQKLVFFSHFCVRVSVLFKKFNWNKLHREF